MSAYAPIDPKLNQLSGVIVDVAFKIHSRLGPGLRESVYETLMERGLKQRGHSVDRQIPISFMFDGVRIEHGFVPDLFVDGSIIVEVKSVQSVPKAFERQLLTYTKAADCRLGLLINFGAPYIKLGIKRMVL